MTSFEMLAQLHAIDRIDGDLMGAIGIVSVAMFFVTTNVAIVTFARMRVQINLARMHQELLQDMLAKGYTPEEIERLLHGSSNWKKIKRAIARHAKNFQYSPTDHYTRTPVPPVKGTHPQQSA